MNTTKLILSSAAALAFVSFFLGLATTKLFTPPPTKGSLHLLHEAQLINLTGAGGFGPESLAFDPNGEGPYTGVADGRILKWLPSQQRWLDFAVTSCQRDECLQPFAPHMEHICGRPLGLRFDQETGDLYIADAYLGLQVVGPAGGLAKQLVKEVEGAPLLFTNDMDIDKSENVVYFTDTSMLFRRRQFISSVLSGDKTGRLLKYDLSSRVTTILQRGLAFANGVALSKDHSFVLVAETTLCRITRLWLRGQNAGKTDTFAELPGYPDNVRRNSKGEFWVALHAKRGTLLRWMITYSWFGKTVLKLPLSFKQFHYLLVGGKAHAIAIKLSENGEIVEVLEDIEGKTLRYISEVEEKNGKLWLGSVMMPHLGIYDHETEEQK